MTLAPTSAGPGNELWPPLAEAATTSFAYSSSTVRAPPPVPVAKDQIAMKITNNNAERANDCQRGAAPMAQVLRIEKLFTYSSGAAGSNFLPMTAKLFEVSV